MKKDKKRFALMWHQLMLSFVVTTTHTTFNKSKEAHVAYVAFLKHCKEKYPAYLAMGLGMLIGLQAFINMSVAVGLFPVTGQPLPLISKGGSSVLMTSGCIGMLLGISNVLEKEERGEEALGTQVDVPAPVDGNESFDEN